MQNIIHVSVGPIESINTLCVKLGYFTHDTSEVTSFIVLSVHSRKCPMDNYFKSFDMGALFSKVSPGVNQNDILWVHNHNNRIHPS